MCFTGGRGGARSGRSCNIEALFGRQSGSSRESKSPSQKVSPEDKSKESGLVREVENGGNGKQESEWEMKTFITFSKVKRSGGR